MPEMFTLLSVTLMAGLVGWFLATFVKSRAVADTLARNHADFETRIGEQSRLITARDAELTTARSAVAEAQGKITSLAEDRARLAAMHESADRAVAQRADALHQLQSIVTTAEAARDAARDRITVLEADFARVTTALEQERRAHNDWMVASRQSESELKATLTDLGGARDAARDRIAAL